jgi:hypothetical protein
MRRKWLQGVHTSNFPQVPCRRITAVTGDLGHVLPVVRREEGEWELQIVTLGTPFASRRIRSDTYKNDGDSGEEHNCATLLSR